MNLSEHFTLEEAIATSHRGIDNDPPANVIENMKAAAAGMESIRLMLGKRPIHINSWYRSPGPNGVNAAVGSKPTSDHVTGFAVDFICPNYGTPQDIVDAILESDLDFKQVILEWNSWCHIAFNGMQRQALVIDEHGTKNYVA
jgi:hypothetical protein